MEKLKQKIDKKGLSQPLFLDESAPQTQVYLDIKSASVELLYSYDPYDRFKRRSDVEWYKFESGRIDSDFACVLYGKPTAVRLKVYEIQDSISIEVTQKTTLG